jgi:integrase
MRKRKQHRGLTNSRIYPKNNRYYLFSPEPIENPETHKLAKWHSLCLISKGELAARTAADLIIKHNSPNAGKGNLPGYMEKYRKHLIARREKKQSELTEPARIKMWQEGTKEINRECSFVAESFADIDVANVVPVDVAEFVDQWEGRRMAEVWLSFLSGFFAWCCRKGYRTDNPCSNVKVEKAKAKKIYITHDQYHAIRDAALIGKDGRPTSSGVSLQCYMDLCYLLYQRTTEIRLLKKDSIDLDKKEIIFKPTKTEVSSAASVIVPISEEIEKVVLLALKHSHPDCPYLIHSDNNDAYTRTGIGSAFRRAAERAGIKGVNLKALRAKAATDAELAGFADEQIMVGLAHTDKSMTANYIKMRLPKRSEVVLPMPAKKQKKAEPEVAG